MKFLRTGFFPISTVLFVLLLMVACVPARKYEEISENIELMRAENEKIKAQDMEIKARNAELEQKIKDQEKDFNAMVRDTLILGNSLRHMQSRYDKINELNDQLLDKYEEVLKMGSENELRTELEILKLSLQTKEDSLVKLEGEMIAKKMELEQFDKKIKELQAAMEAKDKAMTDLKARIAEALKAYEGKGLTLEQKNGKIYVGLEAKLLFASGSTEVDKNGIAALKSLAKAIEDEKDLEIVVEGHTDTDKVIGNKAAYKDNWDLSVLRATAVVRILMDNGTIEPTILSASGRSEFLPVDPSDKGKNRRIEVILSPNLSELYQLVE